METVTREQSITNIIESVALEQTALASILTAEAEKIKKVVSTTTSSAEMLAVNKSVKDMVNTIARLEMILQSKLELFDECLCEETTVA